MATDLGSIVQQCLDISIHAILTHTHQYGNGDVPTEGDVGRHHTHLKQSPNITINMQPLMQWLT